MKNPASSLLTATALALAVLTSSGPFAPAQTSSASAPQDSAPGGPSSAIAPTIDPLPPANPRLFTARSPTVDTVNSFLHAAWGYNANRLYRVMAIQPTEAPGVTRVVVFVTEKGLPDARVQSTTFFVTPDGNFALGDGGMIVPFGAAPYSALRSMLRERATGAFHGAASKDLELVEFSDLQCPHCKEAQPVMEQLARDFPKAHIVFQPFPLIEIHASAFKAAAYGACVQAQSNDAFFSYADAVFDTQDGLTPQTDDTLLKAAVRRANLDPETIARCASSPTTVAQVSADIKLAQDAGINETPTLVVNGRPLPLLSLPYDQLKSIIEFQAKLDGVDSGATPETLASHPASPQ